MSSADDVNVSLKVAECNAAIRRSCFELVSDPWDDELNGINCGNNMKVEAECTDKQVREMDRLKG